MLHHAHVEHTTPQQTNTTQEIAPNAILASIVLTLDRLMLIQFSINVTRVSYAWEDQTVLNLLMEYLVKNAQQDTIAYKLRVLLELWMQLKTHGLPVLANPV